ncbi:hypothetical protein DRW48_03200 [Paracoccus suum]|uniref:DUF2268 domain-containing protein n=1 Tax=Paracoccus suum TaxID=2259340 RepID=A0A344PHH4_9RHOB|nr:DUF2268 domain-containing putative Zn-dependent protease [Paracoccus suum]AXC48829.1 hypothetical protein DRW48_03200 [Paracoccus suum]
MSGQPDDKDAAVEAAATDDASAAGVAVPDGAEGPVAVVDVEKAADAPAPVPEAAPVFCPLPIWNLHPLNARLGLTAILSDLRVAAREAVALASAVTAVPDFDLIVRGQPGAGIAEWGLGGCAPMPGVIEITIDPPRYNRERFVRTLIHEIHHLIRWDGPGYGHSLGEALVSEGLAGHFVVQVLGGAPDPWDMTPPSPGLSRRAMNGWSQRDHDHAAWFFGKGTMRRWAGYGLGHRLIAAHLERHPDATPASLASAPVDRFREDMRRLAQAEDREMPAPQA